MTPEEQFALINTRDWYTAMRTQASTILQVMQTNHFSVAGDDGWIRTEVNGIEASFQLRDQVAFMRVGTNEDGSPMFEWRAPLGWLS